MTPTVRDLVSSGGDGGAVLSVYVQPSANADMVVGRHGDALKLRVAAPPEAGRANKATRALLARLAGVPTNTVELVSGTTNRHKRFRFASLTPDQLTHRLDKWVDNPRS